jgi:hypothetical protein
VLLGVTVPQEDAAKRANSRLKPTQERVLAALAAAGADELTRAQYEQLAGVSRSQAAYDLAELVEARILERLGNGRATRYRVRPSEPATQRRWTEDRIWAELVAFCGGRQTWPTPREFREAGRGDLYVAASRYGGVAHWARALGVEQPARNAPPGPPVEGARLRTRLSWAGAGALAAAVLAAATVFAVGAMSHSANPHRVTAASPGASRAVVADESLHAALAPTVAARTPTVRHTPQRAVGRLSVARTRRSAPSTPTTSVTTSSVAQEASVSAPPTKTWPSGGSTTGASGGPIPLAAPTGGAGPSPLKAP